MICKDYKVNTLQNLELKLNSLDSKIHILVHLTDELTVTEERPRGQTGIV